MPLLWKILLYSSSLLVGLITAMLVYVNHQAERFVGENTGAELKRGIERIHAAEAERLERLELTARLVASFPSLKALLATDFATIRDFLNEQKENVRFELLIVLDPSGRVVARNDTVAPVPLPDAEARWVQPILAGRPALSVLATESGVYHTACVPAVAGGTVFGFVISGSSIDNGFARSLRDVSHNEVVIVGERTLASTLAEARLPWKSRADWESAAGGGSGEKVLEIGSENYLAVTTLLGREGGLQPLAVILQSRDQALAPYRRIQAGLLLLGLLAAFAGISGSAVLAGTITAPLRKLAEGTNQVAAGNFDYRLDIRTRDEIGDLAQSFNVMIRGLRERDDMQKFVSQSTVDMIQSSGQKKISGGERVVRTIFFSDIRGFTPLSERCPPEEVVRILNRCLSLQAERVKKYKGDIDKYVGDCVVALFDGDDMAVNAIRCAVEIHRAIDSYNEAHPNEESILLGIGIATGEVILGSIGSEDRLDFTAIGSHVNLSSRLCSLARPREILLAESTYRRVQDFIAAERLDPLKVKGFSEPVPVYRMTVGGPR